MTDSDEPSLDLLVLSDLHYVGDPAYRCPVPQRHARLGLELAGRAVRRALRGSRPDALVLLGDLVDDGLAPRAAGDLAAIRDALGQFGLPILALPGNHDGPADRLFALFGHRPGLIELGGCQIATIATPYGEGDRTRYPDSALALVANASPDKPLVVLQHNVVHPPIPDAYPYNPTNADAAKRCYAEAGVALSLSGHYHAGIPPQTHGGVTYTTAPALCEEPFRFLRVRLRGRRVEVEEHSLRMPAAPPLWDIHCHTRYAYCGDDVTAQGAIERARLLGLGGIVLAEHAGQLYLPRDEFWSQRFFEDPDLIRRRRRGPECRMDAYLAETQPLRSDFVRLGLEVDSDGRGGLTLLDEDRGPWDLLIGAVHWLPRLDGRTASEAELRRRFMEESESVCRAGVDVLAHPFRYFRRGKLEPPRELYRPMAGLLAETGVAAEINFHTNEPDPRFIAECLAAGVRIALATDSHALWEAGELWPHLDVLREAGAGDDLAKVLFAP